MSFYDRLFGNAASYKDTINTLKWIPLTTENQLEEIKNSSKNKSVVIFKHSTSCGISNMVIKRFEKLFTKEHQSIEVYYLDLLRFRSLSNEISRIFGVVHESPQILVINNEVLVFDASHYDILEINLSRFL